MVVGADGQPLTSLGGGGSATPSQTGLLTETTFTDRVPSKGQKTKSGSLPVTLASDQGALLVDTGLSGLASETKLEAVRSVAANQGVAASVAAPQSLTVSSAAIGLTVPGGMTRATVHVVSGTVRRSIGSTPGANTPALTVGDREDLAGAQLAAYKLIRDGSTDAAVHVEYWAPVVG